MSILFLNLTIAMWLVSAFLIGGALVLFSLGRTLGRGNQRSRRSGL
jgi:hypothetical protein